MLKRILRWTNLVLIFLTLLAYISPFVSPESFWLLSVLGLAFPWLLIAHFLFILFWLVKKDRYVFYSLICLIIGWSNVSNFIGFGYGYVEIPDKAIKVMSYNAHDLKPLFNMHVGEEARANKKEFSRFLQSLGAIHLIIVQEGTQYTLEFFRDSFQMSHYFNSSVNSRKTYIFSKFPILKKGNIQFESTSNSCIWADINIRGKTVRVYNLHLQSNKISDTANKISAKGNIQEKETWEDIGGMFGRYKEASKKRAKQAEKVAAHIAQCPHPIILGGDFNDTPISYPYHILSKGFQDSFKECGRGIGTTYAGKLPGLRIDYVLADKRFEMINHQVYRENFSDHYPVVGTLLFKE